jgi:hypothetical protein
VSNEASTKVTKQLGDTGSLQNLGGALQTGALQTLAKGDKLTITAERIDGGKLRCTGATWSDAVVIYPGEALALANIERQVRLISRPLPAAPPISGPSRPGPAPPRSR